jgi:hypothetical protein
MSVKYIHFLFHIDLTIPEYVSCCVFSSAAGRVLIQNVKNKFTLYFTIYPKVQVGVTSGIIVTTKYCALHHFSLSPLNDVSNQM